MPPLAHDLAKAADAAIMHLDREPHPAYSPPQWKAVVECCIAWQVARALCPNDNVGGPHDTKMRFEMIRLALAARGYDGAKPLGDLITARRHELTNPDQ